MAVDSIFRPLTSFLSVAQQEIVVDALDEVLSGTTFFPTLALIAICEIASHKTVRELRKTKEGASLHNSGLATTLFNFFFLGIPIHILARLYVSTFCCYLCDSTILC
jgi:uncharacterized membrane protein (GlpM family)